MTGASLMASGLVPRVMQIVFWADILNRLFIFCDYIIAHVINVCPLNLQPYVQEKERFYLLSIVSCCDKIFLFEHYGEVVIWMLMGRLIVLFG